MTQGGQFRMSLYSGGQVLPPAVWIIELKPFIRHVFQDEPYYRIVSMNLSN